MYVGSGPLLKVKPFYTVFSQFFRFECSEAYGNTLLPLGLEMIDIFSPRGQTVTKTFFVDSC
jgi:hypothetical protein